MQKTAVYHTVNGDPHYFVTRIENSKHYKHTTKQHVDILSKCSKVMRRVHYRSVVCLCVCRFASCIVLNRQKISTRFLLHTTAPMSLPDSFKIWLTSVNLFLPNFGLGVQG